MTRSRASWLTCAVLIGLTLLTWLLADDGAAAWLLALVALVKVALIGVVFLELARSWPGWAALSLLVVCTVLGGSVLLITGA